MKNFEEIIKSFSVRDTLNPKVWENPQEPEDAKMKKKVLDALEKIADKFIDYLGEDIIVEDIVLTGSLANFNWSEFSDFDLHVIIDFQQYEDEAELYKELYNLKKQIFNEKHNIKIYGYDVELYAQDIDESHFATGTYSIMNKEWIKVPEKIKPEIDKNLLIGKITQWVEKIDKAIRNRDGNEKRLETLKDKLKEYRKSGLEDKGELSYENLVFKFLRRSGHIEKLFKEIDKTVDKELSVERNIQESEVNKKNNKDLLEVLNSSKFLSQLRDIAEQGRTYEYNPGIKIPFSKDVEMIQTALQFLGYSLPKWGVDGKFGPETEKATYEFQKKFDLPSNGKIDGKNLKYLLVTLMVKGFKDSDLSSIDREKEIDSSSISDKNFYERLLQELDAPVTSENMKFLLAWRQSEGKAGRYNPFNTTHKMPNSTNYNTVGVKNYETIEDGLKATIKTLLNGRYDCIVNGLRNDIGANKIASCSSLHTWGTGDLVAKVIRGYESGSSPKISSLA